MKQINIKSVGLFVVLKAPLNPIGAFDAETFKSDFRSVLDSNAEAKFVAVDLTGIEFVYSDAYNAFMQLHQELSSKNGAFAVLADKESLVNSLKKVGLERFIRIFTSEESMAAFQSVDAPKVAINPPKNETSASDHAPAAPAAVAASSEPDIVLDESDDSLEPQTQKDLAPQTPSPISERKVLDSNPLEDESSSSGAVVIVIVLILIAVVAVSYFLL